MLPGGGRNVARPPARNGAPARCGAEGVLLGEVPRGWWGDAGKWGRVLRAHRIDATRPPSETGAFRGPCHFCAGVLPAAGLLMMGARHAADAELAATR